MQTGRQHTFSSALVGNSETAAKSQQKSALNCYTLKARPARSDAMASRRQGAQPSDSPLLLLALQLPGHSPYSTGHGKLSLCARAASATSSGRMSTNRHSIAQHSTAPQRRPRLQGPSDPGCSLGHLHLRRRFWQGHCDTARMLKISKQNMRRASTSSDATQHSLNVRLFSARFLFF